MMTAGRDYGIRVIRAPVIRAPAPPPTLEDGRLTVGRIVLPVRNYPRHLRGAARLLTRS